MEQCLSNNFDSPHSLQFFFYDVVQFCVQLVCVYVIPLCAKQNFTDGGEAFSFCSAADAVSMVEYLVLQSTFVLFSISFIFGRCRI